MDKLITRKVSLLVLLEVITVYLNAYISLFVTAPVTSFK